jgi:hypothetical protein
LKVFKIKSVLYVHAPMVLHFLAVDGGENRSDRVGKPDRNSNAAFSSNFRIIKCFHRKSIIFKFGLLLKKGACTENSYLIVKA